MANTKTPLEHWEPFENGFLNTITGELVDAPTYEIIDLQRKRHCFHNKTTGEPVMHFNMYSVYDQAADAIYPRSSYPAKLWQFAPSETACSRTHISSQLPQGTTHCSKSPRGTTKMAFLSQIWLPKR